MSNEINLEKVMDEFYKKYDLCLTQDEKLILELAVLHGMRESLKIYRDK